MARGWESKSVESQQEERGALARGEVDLRQKKRESIEMSRRRVMNELSNARSDVHRTALQNALRHLDDELSRLG